MNRAAREGRYTGGIRPSGYRVEGHQASARLVPDEAIVWGNLSAAGLVRQMYERIALGGWSCRRVAAELNALSVPTAYARDGRGVRGKSTQGIWRAGRIRNMVTNPVYKGQLQYGRRTNKREREVIGAPIEGLVSPALWQAAQDALARDRRCAKNTRRVYLLRGVVHCARCGLTYVGSAGKGSAWYRCGGQLVERGPLEGRCPGCSIRTDFIEPFVWGDVERFLRDPGDVLDELDGVAEREAQGAIAEVESITLGRALDSLEAQRKQAIALNIRNRFSDSELDAELDRIARERTELEARVAASEPSRAEIVPQEARDLLLEVRARLDAGLTDEQRQEIVRLLVGIVVHTETPPDGKKSVRAVVTYRFPRVVVTRTGRGSWRLLAGIETGRRPLDRPSRSRPARLRAAAGAPQE